MFGNFKKSCVQAQTITYELFLTHYRLKLSVN